MKLEFYSCIGIEKFITKSYDYLLGSWIKLPQKRFYG